MTAIVITFLVVAGVVASFAIIAGIQVMERQKELRQGADQRRALYELTARVVVLEEARANQARTLIDVVKSEREHEERTRLGANGLNHRLERLERCLAERPPEDEEPEA